MSFTTEAGKWYTLRTFNLQPNYDEDNSMDTVIYLYDKDHNVIEEDDDDGDIALGDDYASLITFQAEYSGTYYIAIINYDYWDDFKKGTMEDISYWEGPGTYDFTLIKSDVAPLMSPRSLVTPISKKEH